MSAGRVERVERHAARLRRDAGRLGLPLPDAREIETKLLDAAHDAFGEGDGIVRIEWSRAGEDRPEIITRPRELGPEPRSWRAATSKTLHPGPGERHNTKTVDLEAYDHARQETRSRGVDEVLLYDADGFLVEGGRSNFLVVDESGHLVTPDLALGPVEGLGLTIVLEDRPRLARVRFTRDDVSRARELLCVNAVRGVGGPGRWAERLRSIFSFD